MNKTLRFEGDYTLTKSARRAIPTAVYYSGGLNISDPYNPRFEVAVGDYILINWEPGGIAQFNRYANYGWGNNADNLRAEDFKADFFKQLVGPFGPISVEDVSETKIAG